ncbi:Uncharacterized conserved protein [Legionella steigerwaltii]|uniref:Pyridoxamine 5'-phosphate oxidase n=1 Tax=Legionella steigerwaltii TaxID=460 RepID=A0A378L4R9_9GAMM|nr:pyridoxamine 5'-phosphate oxidase family protein [Legionella steigerwaltii]KTD77349.1 Pyridoxamine 5'-phosphate oxidase [Legionella steigerwaltii]STY22075.1 Uncharacterized conserved protein [Legionella steigerwaltii]
MRINPLDLVNTVEHYLDQWFSFPKNKVFAQVTTVMNQKPHMRTMALYHVTPKGSLIFLTDTSSPKWIHLSHCPNVGVCILNPEYGQIIVEGTAVLDTSQSNLSLASLYWQNFLDEYWRNYYLTNSNKTADGISSSFGIIQIIPDLWQILEINKNDFLKGARMSYELQNDSWIKRQLPLF